MFHKRNLQPLYAICHARLPYVYRPHAQWPICFLPYCCFIRLIILRGTEAGFLRGLYFVPRYLCHITDR